MGGGDTQEKSLVKSLKRYTTVCSMVITLIKTKIFSPELKPFVPKMSQNNVVYKTTRTRCESTYIGQHIIGNKGPIKAHFANCGIIPRENGISILGKPKEGNINC